MQSELVSHDDMLVAYESLRQEMYIVQKENYELKEALRGQSNLFYESDKFKVLK